MTKIILHGSAVFSKEDLHVFLRQSLRFPSWYGNNWDALFDCLTDHREPTELQIIEADILTERLGRDAAVFFHVLQDAAEENPHLAVRIR